MTEFKSTREGYGDALLELGEQDTNVVVVCADLTKSTWSQEFAQKFPKRFVQVGVAEQNMAGISAGLALSGKTVFMASYAAFNPGRNYDFIRTQICYSNANVKIIGSHAGFSAGPDGATHQMLEDIALMRVLPNTTVLSPCDYWEAKKAVIESTKINGPVYVRLHRESTPILTTKESVFEIGKWKILKEGGNACVIGHGPVIDQVLQAREKLLKENQLDIQIVNASSIKPLDEKLLLELAKNYKELFVVEEHQQAGGLGGAICEFLSKHNPTKITILGANNTFGESGNYLQLLEKHGLDKNKIVEAVLKSSQVIKPKKLKGVQNMSQNIVNTVLNSKIFPAVEFSLIITMIIVTYWGMHLWGFTHVKPAAKFTVSMFLGSLGYMIGKLVVIALFAGSVTPETAYAF